LGDVACNQWTFWIYPVVSEWPDQLAVYDPGGTLAGLDDLMEAATLLGSHADLSAVGDKILLSSLFSAPLADFVRQGGRALLIQTGAGSLPNRPCPFWREAIKLIYDHPALGDFPHRGHADSQFYHLATDHALDLAALQATLPEIEAIQPVIRRLDARQFTALDYLAEIRLGSGTALLSSLRFTGGAGDQTVGIRANVAGRYLFRQALAYLEARS
jgi:hypothetical protein